MMNRRCCLSVYTRDGELSRRNRTTEFWERKKKKKITNSKENVPFFSYVQGANEEQHTRWCLHNKLL